MEATMAERETSAAYLALPKSAKRLLTAIESEIADDGGTCAPVSHITLIVDHRCGAPSHSLRLLTYLGIVDRKLGRNNVAIYALSARWRDLSEADVVRLTQLAREVKPREGGRTNVGAG